MKKSNNRIILKNILIKTICLAIGIAGFFYVFKPMPHLTANAENKTPPLSVPGSISVTNIKTGEEYVFEGSIYQGETFLRMLTFISPDKKEKMQPMEGYRIEIPDTVMKYSTAEYTQDKFNAEVYIKDSGKTEKFSSVKLSDSGIFYSPFTVFYKDDGKAVIYSKSDIVINKIEKVN